MRTTLQLAATLLLTGATAACAQISNPDNLVAPPPKPPEIRHPQASDDLQWLWQYTKPAPNGTKSGLTSDLRFKSLLQTNLKAPQSMWGLGVPLSEAAQTFLGGDGKVASTDNRHLTVTGCVVEHCAQRGLLFTDMAASRTEHTPFLVFAALRWNEQDRTPDNPHAPFTLWIFPSHELDAQQLPHALKESVSAFVGGGCDAPSITNVIVVEPDGVPHIIGSLDAGIQPAYCPPGSNPNNASPQGTHS
jgi:hypothetical protein